MHDSCFSRCIACMQDHGGSVHRRWTLPGSVGQEPREGARCKANRRWRKRLRRRRHGCLLPEAAAATAAAGDLGGRVISNRTRPIIFIRRSVCMHLSSRLIISMHVRLIHLHPSPITWLDLSTTTSSCVASNMYNDCNLSSANCSCSRFYMILQLDLYILILFSLSGTAVDRA